MSYKYYVAGKEITQSEKDKLLSGNGDKTVFSPKGQPGIPFAVASDYFKVINGILDISDQLLRKCLNKIGLDIKKTFIVQNFKKQKDSLDETQKVSIYGCW